MVEDSGIKAEKAPSQVWIYGINDHLDFDEARVAAFQTTGDFCRDYPALCKELGVVAHSSFASPQRQRDTTDSTQNLIISANSILMDKISVQILRTLLTRCHDLNTVKFSYCKVDIEMMEALRQGLDERSTIQTLQVDWNPLEVPLEIPAPNKDDPIELTGQLLDKLESEREAQQNRRLLIAFKERLQDFNVKLTDAEHEVMLTVSMDINQFMTFFDERNMRGDDICEMFEVLDGPFYGSGSGYVKLEDLVKAIEEVAPSKRKKVVTNDEEGKEENGAHAEEEGAQNEEEEEEESSEPEQDVVGKCFATFLDGECCVENISFRYCALTRSCMIPMANALMDNKHMRILNLWGNRLNDKACVSLAPVLAVHSGIQYLGLGRNWITHLGLQSLQEYIAIEVTDPTEAQARIKEQEEKAQKFPTPTKTAPSGRERWKREVPVDQLEERGEELWIWRRNTTLQILHVGENRITDSDAILKLIPLGIGTLVLTGNPCVPVIQDTPLPKLDEGIQSWKLHL